MFYNLTQRLQFISIDPCKCRRLA